MSDMTPYLDGGRRAIKIKYAYQGYAEGGLVEAAEDVRGAGRHGDSVLVHVNPEEFEKMRAEFGDPLINPETGIPEWGFLDSLKKIAKKLLPVLGIAAMVIPGMQAFAPALWAGRGVTAATGALGMMGGAGVTGAAANALGGAALGALTGGKKGAVTGALGGFAASPGNPVGDFASHIPGVSGMSPEAQTMIGRGVLGAGGAALTGRDPLQGALSSVALGGLGDKISNSGFVQNDLSGALQQGALGGAKGVELAGLTGADPVKGAAIGATLGAADRALQRFREQPVYGPATPDAAYDSHPEVAPAPGALSSVSSAVASAIPLNMTEFAQFKSKKDALQKFGAGQNPDQREIYDALEKFTVCDLSGDFGGCMAQNWDAFMRSIRQNAPKMAEGGQVEGALAMLAGPPHEGMVNGPGDGQSDSVPINAARGEVVIPADVVAALGSGSSDAGAEALDTMVQNIRKHIRGAPTDRNPPKAKSPLQYLGER